MKGFIAAVLLAFAVCGVAGAETVIVTTTVTTAQQDAESMARTGVLRHCGRAGGRREGIGFSTAGPDAAERSCCFYSDAMRGRYRIVERGVAYSTVRRGWFACIRYE
jgi:hypothetical protein